MDAGLRLDRPTRRWLVWVDRKTRDADLRIRSRVLLKIHAGASPHAAARALGCAPSTACRIVARFREAGELSVFDGRWANGTRKIGPVERRGICRVLAQRPPDFGYPRPSWTLELLVRVIERQLGVKLSVGHLWKVLKSFQVRWGMTRPVVCCPWPAARRKRRLAQLRRLAAHPAPHEAVVYADEVDLHLNPKIGRDWMLPGTQRRIVTPGKNQKHYLAGALDLHRQQLVCVEGDRKATWLFLNLLRALADAYRWAHTVHVILDNFIIHKTRLVQSMLRQMRGKIRLHFLPPYCPDDNRIEPLWREMHANVTRNHGHRAMQQLIAAALRWLATRFSDAQELAHAA